MCFCSEKLVTLKSNFKPVEFSLMNPKFLGKNRVTIIKKLICVRKLPVQIGLSFIIRLRSHCTCKKINDDKKKGPCSFT